VGWHRHHQPRFSHGGVVSFIGCVAFQKNLLAEIGGEAISPPGVPCLAQPPASGSNRQAPDCYSLKRPHHPMMKSMQPPIWALLLMVAAQPVSAQSASPTPTPAPVALHLSWSTYLGGATPAPTRLAPPYAPAGVKDEVRFMAFDSQGNLYATGQAAAVNFPTTIGPPHAGDVDAFVAKFTPSGELIWSRLLGGPNHDRTYGLAVAADDSYVLICGRAGPGLPTTPGVYQPTFAGDSNAGTAYGQQDGFAAAINADGSTRWVTYFGSSDDDIVRSCDLGAHGEAYLGWEGGENHAAKGTPGAFRTTPCGSNTNHQDFGIAKLSSDGRQLLWFTYLCGNSGTVNASEGPHIRVQNLCGGGSRAGARCALDTECSGGTCVAGRVYFKTPCWDSNFFLNNSDVQTLVNPVQGFQGSTGNTCLAVVSGDGSALEFSSFWSGASEIDGINILSDGSLAVCTIIRSDKTLLGKDGHFQSTFAGGNADCAAAKIRVTAPTSVIASTYVGSNGWEGQCVCGVDASENFWLGGNTDGTNWPITTIRQQANNAGGVQDAVATLLRSDFNGIGFSTYLGGNGDDQMRHAATRNGLYALGGSTTSTNFPVRNAMQPQQSDPNAPNGDAWVALFAAASPPTWTPTSGLPTVAPTNSTTPTATVTAMNTSTGTATLTSVPATSTPSLTHPPSATGSPTPPPTATASASRTVPTAMASATSTPPPATATLTPTVTQLPTGTATTLLTATFTPTNAPSTSTPTPTNQAPTISTQGSTPTVTKSPRLTATPTPTAPPATFTQTSAATATVSPPLLCVGDCNDSGTVSVTDVVTMVNIALDALPVSACAAGTNQDEPVTINEIVAAVRNILAGCPGRGPLP
jgi:hypothetical protein